VRLTRGRPVAASWFVFSVNVAGESGESGEGGAGLPFAQGGPVGDRGLFESALDPEEDALRGRGAVLLALEDTAPPEGEVVGEPAEEREG
jgi:hypothetical protein